MSLSVIIKAQLNYAASEGDSEGTGLTLLHVAVPISVTAQLEELQPSPS